MENQEIKKKKVSFSQYSMWMKCPYSWKLNYLEGKRIYDASLNIFFGTAIHHSIQTFLQTLYTESVEKADSLNLYELFKVKFEDEIVKEKSKPDSKFTFTDDEYTEFIFDGEDILKTFLSSKNRLKYFPSQKYEFIGIEVPLDMSIKNNVDFIAYLDLVLKDKETGKYKIYDFKTSSNGWNKYQKEDRLDSIPLGFLRGLNWNAKCIVADEAQNMTVKELTTLITRVGEFSKVFILGDPDQSDINGKSGFMKIMSAFDDDESKENGIYTFKFTEEDIVRSTLVKYIVKKLKNVKPQ